MANHVMKMNYQRKTQKSWASTCMLISPATSNIWSQSATVQTPSNDIGFFYNGVNDKTSKKATDFRREMATNGQIQYSHPMQMSDYDKISYNNIPSLRSPPLFSTKLLSSTCLSPEHHKTFGFSAPSTKIHHRYAGFFNSANGYKSVMMSMKNFQANHCRDFSQNHCNTWYLTSPRTDPRKRWEQAEGTNQSNFSSKPSSAWSSQKILVPKHERLMHPLHLQEESKTKHCRSPRKKFSPGKKGYKTNSTKP